MMYETFLLIPILLIGTYAQKQCRMFRGECVPAYLCLNGIVNVGGATLIDIRTAGDAPLHTVSSDKNDGMKASRLDCAQHEVCCSYSSGIIHCHSNIEYIGHTQVLNTQCKDTQVSDNQAKFVEVPWMVGIFLKVPLLGVELYAYYCGGSLIDKQIVLTAAHCVQAVPAHFIKVRSGEWDIRNNQEPYRYDERKVVKIIIHEDYDLWTSYNDIALLYLETQFKMAPNLHPLYLPGPLQTLDFTRCYGIGWGDDEFKDGITYGQKPNILKKIKLPIVPNDQCQASLRNTRLGKYFELHSSFMCAGGEPGKDTCKGDGGSPLVCKMINSSSFFQVGIVAWGIGCGEENIPGVYTDVLKMIDWISENIVYK